MLLVEKELQAARAAQAQGNVGRARVCARRAAGFAVRAWYQQRLGTGWGGDALKQLHHLQADALVPEAVRAAAKRLTTKVDADHSLPFTEDPIVDAEQIVAFVQKKPEGL